MDVQCFGASVVANADEGLIDEALGQGQNTRQHSTQPLPNVQGTDVLGGEVLHEGDEDQRGGTVDESEPERQYNEGHAVDISTHCCCPVPRQGQQDTCHQTYTHNSQNSHCLYRDSPHRTMLEGVLDDDVCQWSNVGHLYCHGQDGRQRETLG